VKYAFIHAHRQEFSLRLMCRVLEVARSGYYAFERCPKGARQLDNERLLEQVKQIHEASGKTYGSPRVHGQLMAQGEGCSRGRVARLMARAGIRVVSKRRFVVTTASAHTLPVAPNLLEQQFEVLAPGRVWVSDITYIPVVEGWLYLAVVMDLCSRRVLGWSMGERLGRRLVLHAVDMARLRQCPAPGLIVHTDRGSQYASRDYRHLLSRYGMRASMSRKGNCWDNAPTALAPGLHLTCRFRETICCPHGSLGGPQKRSKSRDGHLPWPLSQFWARGKGQQRANPVTLSLSKSSSAPIPSP